MIPSFAGCIHTCGGFAKAFKTIASEILYPTVAEALPILDQASAGAKSRWASKIDDFTVSLLESLATGAGVTEREATQSMIDLEKQFVSMADSVVSSAEAMDKAISKCSADVTVNKIAVELFCQSRQLCLAIGAEETISDKRNELIGACHSCLFLVEKVVGLGLIYLKERKNWQRQMQAQKATVVY